MVQKEDVGGEFDLEDGLVGFLVLADPGVTTDLVLPLQCGLVPETVPATYQLLRCLLDPLGNECAVAEVVHEGVQGDGKGVLIHLGAAVLDVLGLENPPAKLPVGHPTILSDEVLDFRNCGGGDGKKSILEWQTVHARQPL